MPLPIAQLGQPVLRMIAPAIALSEIDSPHAQQLIDQMLETVKAAGGAGLAGPQVFLSARIFVAAVRQRQEGSEPVFDVFINPRIVRSSSEQEAAWEGCLSFPELQVLVSRPLAVTIEFLDRHAQAQSLDLTGFPARVVQHELDHLDGILTFDRAQSTQDIVKASELEDVLHDRAARAETTGTDDQAPPIR